MYVHMYMCTLLQASISRPFKNILLLNLYVYSTCVMWTIFANAAGVSQDTTEPHMVKPDQEKKYNNKEELGKCLFCIYM